MKIGQDDDFVQYLKRRKIYYNETLEGTICEYTENNFYVSDVTLFYTLSTIFSLSKLNALNMLCIERCFAMVAKIYNFIDLEFDLVRKIFSSSELHITSELEVFDAADKLVYRNFKERRKFSRDLLLTIRLSCRNLL